ncbi:MAG: hypothetical protein ABEK02_06905 [Haloquadratum sp.]
MIAEAAGLETALAAGVSAQMGLRTVVEAPAPLRAVVVFLGSTVFGGLVLYRYGDRTAAAVDTSTTNPVVSVVYGFVAFGLVVFFLGYAASQLARVGLGGRGYSVLLWVVLGVALFALAGLGFAVVGQWATETAGFADPWPGLVATGLLGAVAVLVFPFALGALVWFGIAAVGIGGPVKRWIHADRADQRET